MQGPMPSFTQMILPQLRQLGAAARRMSGCVAGAGAGAGGRGREGGVGLELEGADRGVLGKEGVLAVVE